MKRFLVLLLGVVFSAFFAAPAFATEGTTPMGWLEICKASNGTLVDNFSFKLYVNGQEYHPAGFSSISAPQGACTAAMPVPAGEVRVEEQAATEPDGHGGSFSSFDYTRVTAIHTTAPGALDAQLVAAGTSLAGRYATVVVNESQYSTDETMVTFTNDPVMGYVEICKTQTAGAGLEGLSFPFTITGGNGFTWSGSVVATLDTMACTDPILAPAGRVIVQETGTQYVAGITSPNSMLTDMPPNQDHNSVLNWTQVANGWASVDVTKDGTVSGESVVSFEDNTSQLKICKISADGSSPSLVGKTFHFIANGTPVDVVADPSNSTGHCVVVGSYPAGTAMVVTELPTPGVKLQSIALSDARTLTSQSGSDFVGNSAGFTLAAGVETITFTDIADPGGQLKVCKHGPAGEPAATFDVTGPRGVAFATVEGTDTLVVPVGDCVFVPMPKLPYAGMQTITERPQAGYSVASATVQDAKYQASDLDGNSIGAYVGSGSITVVTFTDVAAAPSVDGGTSSAGAGAAGAVTSAPPAASGDQPVQQKAAAVVTPAVTKTKAIVKSTLSSTRIANHHVYVRVIGSAPKATIRVTLLNAKHKVIRSVLRSVQTNRSVAVANLKLGPAVKSVKVKVL